MKGGGELGAVVGDGYQDGIDGGIGIDSVGDAGVVIGLWAGICGGGVVNFGCLSFGVQVGVLVGGLLSGNLSKLQTGHLQRTNSIFSFQNHGAR
jgi:hypothetical protein